MKSKIKKIIGIILIILVAVISVAIAMNQTKPETQTVDATSDTELTSADTTSAVNEDESSAETTEEVATDVVKESESVAIANQETEPTTKKSEATTKMPESTTKKTETTKVTETTTETLTFTTWDGKSVKPYEVFVDETGTEYYYDNEGFLCCAESLTAKPIVSEYDADCCYKCGDKNCFPTMSGYYCVICEKDIPALTCHAKAHYYASK